MSLTPLQLAVIKTEYRQIVEALELHDFNKTKAAKYLGIDRKTLYNKLKKYRDVTGRQEKKIA